VVAGAPLASAAAPAGPATKTAAARHVTRIHTPREHRVITHLPQCDWLTLSPYHRRGAAVIRALPDAAKSYTPSSAFFILRIASMCSRGESPDPIVFTDRCVAPRSCHSRARRVHSAGPPME